MLDVPLLIMNLHLVPLSSHHSANFFRPVCMPDTVYQCAVNIAAGIDDIANMFDCIVVVYNLLDGLD